MIARLLNAIARRRPARVIRIKGTPYMVRYHLFTIRRLGITAYLHNFLTADGDRNVHNHPWCWQIGIPLVGHYCEDRLVAFDAREGLITRRRTIRRFRINYISSLDQHRIRFVKPGTWTLFIHGRRFFNWGFSESLNGNNGESGVIFHQPLAEALDGDLNICPWYMNAPSGAYVQAELEREAQYADAIREAA